RLRANVQNLKRVTPHNLAIAPIWHLLLPGSQQDDGKRVFGIGLLGRSSPRLNQCEPLPE
ncbi:MAG: hypothetical protein ACC649_01360, partial [Myxococcota bacterium]